MAYGKARTRADCWRFIRSLICAMLLVSVVYFVGKMLTSDVPPEPFMGGEKMAKKGHYSPVERKIMQFTKEEDWEVVRDLRDVCEDIPERVRLADVECRAELAYRLRTLLPTQIHAVVQFRDPHMERDWFAMEISFGDNVRAWFKPCSCGREELGLRRELTGGVMPEKADSSPLLTVSARLDPRFLRIQSFGMPEWAKMVLLATDVCGEKFPLTKSHELPRIPGCLLYWSDTAKDHIDNDLGLSINEILQSLRCDRVNLVT